MNQSPGYFPCSGKGAKTFRAVQQRGGCEAEAERRRKSRHNARQFSRNAIRLSAAKNVIFIYY